MSFKVTVNLSKEIKLSCGFDAAFDIFSDVRKMAAFFPDVDRLEDMGENAWKWTMKSVGISKYSMAVQYAARYSYDREGGRITWGPVAGIGNGVNSGSAIIHRDGPNATRVDFSTSLELEIPFSSLAKPILKPFVESQFKSTLEKFEQNVINGVRNA
jgi:carbon monoxide dehydrogenase subunit G